MLNIKYFIYVLFDPTTKYNIDFCVLFTKGKKKMSGRVTL